MACCSQNKFAQHQLSHMCGTGETSLGMSCVIYGNGDPTAELRMIHFLQEINFENWQLYRVYAKEMDPIVLLLSTKASSSQWVHEV